MLLELTLLVISHIVTFMVVFVALFAATVPFRIRISLATTILALLFWQDTVYISNMVDTDLVFWNNFVFIWPTIAVASFFLFMHQLNEHKRWDLQGVGKYLQWSPVVLLLIGLSIQAGSILTGTIFYMTDEATLARGSAYGYYIVGLVLSLIAVLGHLVLSYKNVSKKSERHKAVKTVFYTVLFAVGYGLALNVAIPLLTGSQTYASLGIITVDIFAVGFALSVIKDKLVDLKLYAVRTFVYVLSLTSLALIYGVLAFTVSNFFLGYTDTPVQQVINVSLALVLAFIFQPVKRFFDKVTSKIFFRDDYTTDEFFSRLNKILSSAGEMRTMLERVAEYIATSLKAEYVAFFIYHRDGHHLTAGSEGYKKLPTGDARELDGYAARHQYNIFATKDVREASVRKLLLSHRSALTLPLEYDGQILGYLLLGEHRRSGYTTRDMQTLKTVEDELVIAIQNALSVQEVRDINAHLQQRIDAATKELRASNAQLQRLDEAKDEFISMASHQLRTPLTSIKGYVSMLMEGDVGTVTPEQKHLLREAFISSERMVRLIGDFLNVSRLQTGKFVIEKHPVDLALLVHRELEALEPNAAARGLKFEYVKPKHFPKLNLDENKIQQVIMNFSDNAIYYSKEASTIKVSLKVTKDAVEFRVKDSGIGVPAAQQDQLFNKFFRATNARQQRPDGTGVGLFLAKKVIDAHHGEIIFESKENKGSTFGFRLPLQKLRAD